MSSEDQMSRADEVAALKAAAGIGYGYAERLIDWFDTAEKAIDYLCAAPATQGELLNAAIFNKRGIA